MDIIKMIHDTGAIPSPLGWMIMLYYKPGNGASGLAVETVIHTTSSISKRIRTSAKKMRASASLAPGGRCAVVVPEGLLLGSTWAHVEVHRKLGEAYELLAAVSLPAGVFKPYGGVKTGVLVIRKPTSTQAKKVSKVWFYEVRADAYDPDKITGGSRPETPERNDIPDLLTQWTVYKQSGFRKATGGEAGTLLKSGSPEPRSWWATTVVAQNDYNLAAGRYKPQMAEKPPDEDPAQLIQETLAIERGIASGLEKLPKDVEP